MYYGQLKIAFDSNTLNYGLIGSGIGALGGAGLGALTAGKGKRGKGALMGALGGGLLGGGIGAGYGHFNPKETPRAYLADPVLTRVLEKETKPPTPSGRISFGTPGNMTFRANGVTEDGIYPEQIKHLNFDNLKQLQVEQDNLKEHNQDLISKWVPGTHGVANPKILRAFDPVYRHNMYRGNLLQSLTKDYPKIDNFIEDPTVFDFGMGLK
jgi:hypothetical protein